QYRVEVAGRMPSTDGRLGRIPRPTPRVGEAEIAFSKPAATSKTQGGCFMPTAAYGCALEPEVATLCAFRDRVVRPWRPGRTFIRIYERLSPPSPAGSPPVRSRVVRFD